MALANSRMPKMAKNSNRQKIILVANEVSEHAPMMGGPTFFPSLGERWGVGIFVVPNAFS